MKAYITRHSSEAQKWPRMTGMQALPMLAAHEGDSIDRDFTGGEAHTDALEAGVYEITILGGNARIKIGADVVATEANGQLWIDGRSAVRFVREGQRISVIAAS